MRKALITILTGIAGLLLTLSGLDLIELSSELILYTGILLLVVSALSYIFSKFDKPKLGKPQLEESKEGGDK